MGMLYYNSYSGFCGCGCGRLKTGMYEVDNTLVPPSFQSDSVSLSASESQEVFPFGRIKK